ncbi:glutaredoxin [Paxillus ammoniavirescens]|nr:glutaredoxin [Paxillus ammoniavirescens]
MNKVVVELAGKYPELLVLQVEAEVEENADIVESFGVEAVPLIILLRGHTQLGRISGADARAVVTSVDTHLRKGASLVGSSNGSAEKNESNEGLEERMLGIMKQSHVVLFMKGNPQNPRCGFSRQAVDLLHDRNVKFTHFDILQDDDVRQGLKTLNDWPTYPQFIVNGEFVGGLDVVKEMDSEEFADTFGGA